MKDIVRVRENEELSAFMKAAVEKVIRFAGKHGEYPGPIVIVVGDRSVAEVNAFVAAIHEEMPDIGTIRRLVQGTDLTRYLNHDPNPDPIFYRDVQGDPTNAVQRMLAERCIDQVRRYQLPPLLLVAVKHQPSPHPQPAIPSRALNPAFAECVGARIVDISKAAEQTDKVKLKTLFLTVVSCKNGPTVEPEAEALIDAALEGNATTSGEAVIKLAKAVKARAKKLAPQIVTFALLWDIFPAQFREAVRPGGLTVR